MNRPYLTATMNAPATAEKTTIEGASTESYGVSASETTTKNAPTTFDGNDDIPAKTPATTKSASMATDSVSASAPETTNAPIIFESDDNCTGHGIRINNNRRRIDGGSKCICGNRVNDKRIGRANRKTRWRMYP